MAAARSARAAEVPICSKQSAPADPAGADGSSACAFDLAFGVPSKQADVQLGFLVWTTLPKVEFSRLILRVISQWKNLSRLKPKEKIHLLNSVLTN